MTRTLLALIAAAVLGHTGLALAGQTPPDEPAAEQPAPDVQPVPGAPPEPAAQQPDGEIPPDDSPAVQVPPPRFGNPALRIGGDYALPADTEIQELVVISGDARIEGSVRRDVVVILGTADVSGTAVIGGSLVVIGGSATIASGARVERDLVVIGGEVDAPPGFAPGHEHVVIDTGMFGVRIEPLVPWVARGLLWGRPIVPGLPWVWGVVGLIFLVSLALNLLLDRPVHACAQAVAERPLTTLGVGLLALLLSGPAFLLLAVSVVGILVIPFVTCALLVAWILGRVGVTRWLGLTMFGGTGEDGGRPSRARASAALTAGFAVLCVAYMIPILGLLAWTMVGVLGLGAAIMAFLSGYRRENPVLNGGRRWGRSGTPVPPPVPPPAGTPWDPTRDTPGPPPTDTADEGAGSGAPERPSDGRDTMAGDARAGARAFTPPPDAPYGTGSATELLSFRRAFFRERLAAFALDLLLVGITVNLLEIVLRDDPRTVMVLLLVYYVAFWAWKGTSVGGIICQLRIVRAAGTPMQPGDAVVRGLAGILSLAALGLGGFWILIDQERQAWHDKVAGTYVVKVPRHWPV